MLFFSESGCKGKNFIRYLPNIFGSFFLFFFFLVVSLCEREAKEKGKSSWHRSQWKAAVAGFVWKAGAKVRTLKHIFQMFRKFFFHFSFLRRWFDRNHTQKRRISKGSYTVFCQNVKVSLPSFPKADAKVGLLAIHAKYIYHFFITFHELFYNSLIDKHVVEHNFSKIMYKETEGIHYIYTCAHGNKQISGTDVDHGTAGTTTANETGWDEFL